MNSTRAAQRFSLDLISLCCRVLTACSSCLYCVASTYKFAAAATAKIRTANTCSIRIDLCAWAAKAPTMPYKMGMTTLRCPNLRHSGFHTFQVISCKCRYAKCADHVPLLLCPSAAFPPCSCAGETKLFPDYCHLPLVL